jgi:hypothetical protein
VRLHPGNAAALLWALLVLLSPVLSACGPAEAPDEPSTLQSHSQDLNVTNGLAFNGLAFNGLAFNGLAFNGLAFNGLNSSDFHAWFQQEPALRNSLMSYLIQCAVPSGQSRTYTAPNGTTYTWKGNLGLAPGWASGKPATVKEQQVVSACLAAHGNKYGVKLPISVLGKDAKAVTISYTSSELTTFSEKEGCFFGNLFNGNEGLYAVSDGHQLDADESTARGCALSVVKNDTTQDCPPLIRIGTFCAKICIPDASKNFYTSCTYNGITYTPITTRIRPQEIYQCGDGVCQMTEKCGTGTTADSCMSDCGVCP